MAVGVCKTMSVPIDAPVFTDVYREVAHVVAQADEVRELVLDETHQLLKQFVTCVTRDVPWLRNEPVDEYEVRRIGGYRFHLYSDDGVVERGKHTYFPMEHAMPVIQAQFRRKLPAIIDTSTLDELRKLVMEDEVEEAFEVIETDKPTSKEASDAPRGLVNIGNTCFLNATLQCLASLHSFTAYFCGEVDNARLLSTQNSSLLRSFTTLLRELSTGQVGALPPFAFHKAVLDRWEPYGGDSEEDAEEFANWMLSQLNDELRSNPSLTAQVRTENNEQETSAAVWSRFMAVNNSIVAECFGGQTVTRVRCSECGRSSTTFAETWMLPLNLSSDSQVHSVEELIVANHESTRPPDLRCENQHCGRIGVSNKATRFARSPKFLFVSLSRFQHVLNGHDQHGNPRFGERKLFTEVSIPEEFTFEAEFDATNMVDYRLVAILAHVGASMSSGHYTATVRRGNQWHHCNDSCVQLVDDHNYRDRQDATPYLLFYERVDEVQSQPPTAVAAPLLGMPPSLANLVERFPVTPCREFVRPSYMPLLPAQYASRDLWQQLPMLRSTANGTYVCGREQMPLQLDFSALTTLAYPNPSQALSNQLLVHDGWLSDGVISDYMELLQSFVPNVCGFQVRCFGTTAMQTMQRLRRIEDLAERSRRYLASFNPLSVEWVVCPANTGDHFILFVYNVSTATLNVMDSLYSGRGSEIAATPFIRSFTQYLAWRISATAPSFVPNSIHVKWAKTRVPQQGNSRDCGVYACLYALYTLLDLPMDFNDVHIPYFRRKLLWDLLSGTVLLVDVDDEEGSVGETPAPIEHEPIVQLATAFDAMNLDDGEGMLEDVKEDLGVHRYDVTGFTPVQQRFVESATSKSVRIRFCTRECASFDLSTRWAQQLKERIGSFQSLLVEWEKRKNTNPLALLCEAFEECEDPDCSNGVDFCQDMDDCGNCLNILNKLCHCYMSLRAVRTRYSNLLRNAIWLHLHELALQVADIDVLQQLGFGTTLSQKIRHELAAIRRRSSAEIHTEGHVLAEYSEQLDACRDVIAQLRVHECEICQLFNYPQQAEEQRLQMRQTSLGHIRRKCAAALPPSLSDSTVTSRDVRICRSCLEAINGSAKRASRIPANAVVNELTVEEVPEQLRNLNWIETILCQLVRPLQALVLLKPLSGTTPHALTGAKGGILYMPMSIESTLNYTMDALRKSTLPSAHHLQILVHSKSREGVDSRCVANLSKVFAALNWLKAHNEFYSDITINRDFVLDYPNLASTPKCEKTEEDDSPVPSLLVSEYGLTDVEGAKKHGVPTEEFRMTEMTGRPVSFEEKTLEYCSFPTLFPRGRYGMHATRRTLLRPSVYLHNRMWNHHRRFSQQKQYLFHSANWQDMKAISEAVVWQLKKTTRVQGKKKQLKVMGADITKAIIEGDPQLDEHFSSYFPKLRGHRDYWRQQMMNVKAMIQYFGPATFFVTLNPAEWNWPELHQQYAEIYGEEVTASNVSEFVARDPAIFADHFNNRLEKGVIKMVVQSPTGPLGKVRKVFLRREWQVRGATHIHMLVWVEDAPVVGVNTEEEITKFIEERITCRIPDPVEEPTLYRLVTQFQSHHCTASCRRLVSNRHGKIGGVICRYQFPRPVSRITKLNLGSDLVQKKGGLYHKGYVLPRNQAERMTNDYNPALLMALRANMDIQFVSNPDPALIGYVTGYTTKGEKKPLSNEMAKLIEDLDFSNPNRRALWKYGSLLLRQRQLGQVEAAHRLMSLPLYTCSVDIVFLNTNPRDERVKTMRPLSELVKLPDDAPDEARFSYNFIDNYYPNRPNELEGYCLFNIFCNFVYVKTERGLSQVGAEHASKTDAADAGDEDEEGDGENADEGDLGDNDIFAGCSYHTSDRRSPFFKHLPPPPKKPKKGQRVGSTTAKRAYKLKEGLGFFRLKRKQILPRLFWPNYEQENEECIEDWYRRCCLLFVPFRKEDELRLPYASHEERFKAYCDEIKELSPNAFADLDRLIQSVITQKLEDQQSREERRQVAKELATLLDSDLPAEEDKLEDIQPLFASTPEEAASALGRLNEEQRFIVDFIIQQILAQGDSVINENAVREFVTGVAGTGKSEVINVLRMLLDQMYGHTRQVCVVTAPTGVAALNVHGFTAHSVFHFEVQQGAVGEYVVLSDSQRDKLIAAMQETRLVILDECSLWSDIMLYKLNHRMCEIGNPDLWFGGYNLLLVGDLLQLPPVMGMPIYRTPGTKLVRRVFASIFASINLWSLFGYYELTQNMRQREDLEYATMMNRVRLGSPTDDDIRVLMSWYISVLRGLDFVHEDRPPAATELPDAVDYYLSLFAEDPTAVCIFPTNVEVDAFNEEVMKKVADQIGVPILQIKAHDSRAEELGKKRRPWQWEKYRITGSNVGANEPREGWKRAERIAGGLPEAFRVHIGARVMIRRNLDQREYIVNGTVGVVERFEYSTDAAEVSDPANPSKIWLRLDDGRQYAVTRRSATFQVGPNLYKTRWQFPLYPAFAITGHKSQSLTVKNAVVSITRSFENSLAYVILSRVKALHGLHLMDFHPVAIRCDVRTVREYNRLRANSQERQVLTSLPEPNVAPPISRIFKRPKVTVKTYADEALDAEISPAQPKRGRKKRKPPASTKITKGEPGTPPARKKTKRVPKIPKTEFDTPTERCPFATLPLANRRGVDCFFNGAIQLLRVVPEAMEFFRQGQRNLQAHYAHLPSNSQHRFTFELGDLLGRAGDGTTPAVTAIRASEYFPARLRNGQQDASEVLGVMLALENNLQEHRGMTLGDLFGFDYTRVIHCERCRQVTSRQRVIERILQLPLNVGTSDFTTFLERHFPTEGKRSVVEGWKCSVCASRLGLLDEYGNPMPAAPITPGIVVENWEIEGSPYLLLQLPLFNQAGVRQTSRFTDVDQELLLFHGSHWRMVGTILHFGDSPREGHYYAAIRNGPGQAWWIMEDAAPPRLGGLASGLVNHFLLLLQRSGKAIKTEELERVLSTFGGFQSSSREVLNVDAAPLQVLSLVSEPRLSPGFEWRLVQVGHQYRWIPALIQPPSSAGLTTIDELGAMMILLDLVGEQHLNVWRRTRKPGESAKALLQSVVEIGPEATKQRLDNRDHPPSIHGIIAGLDRLAVMNALLDALGDEYLRMWGRVRVPDETGEMLLTRILQYGVDKVKRWLESRDLN